MRVECRLAAWVCGGAALLAGAGRAGAVVIYDSGGFESPRYTSSAGSNNLQGQDQPPTGQGPWLKDTGTSTGVVQTTNSNGGTQSVQVTRVASSTGDTRWGVSKPATPTAALNVVRVDFDMRVEQASFGGTPPTNSDFGPAFGVEVYDSSVNPNSPKLIGSLTLDATTGDVLYQKAGTGILTETGTVLTRGSYHHYELAVDFTSKSYLVFADGVPLHNEGFVDNTASTFTDAPIAAFAATGTSVNTGTGTGFFDNYQIQQVPEPATAAVLGTAGLGLLARRRGRRSR